MAEYCTALEVENRLTEAGYLNLADRDQDDTVNAAEVTKYITPAISRAGRKIDFYVGNRAPPYSPSSLRSANNQWCRDRCVDLAAWYVATNGGREAPESFQVAYDEAIEELKQVMEDAAVIPDAPIDSPYDKDDHTPFEIQSQAVT